MKTRWNIEGQFPFCIFWKKS